jgi:hypothetical protein
MAYRFTPIPSDNSTIESRQVRRQRERLAKKARTDTPPRYLMGPRIVSSRYLPHCGKKQIAKNLAKMGRA